MDKTVLTLGILIVILVGILAVMQFPQLNLFGGNAFEDLKGVDVNNFALYRDDSGFEIAYPITFHSERVLEGEKPVGVLFTSATVQMAQVLQVVLSNETASSIKNSVLSELTAAERKTVVEGNAFGSQVMEFEKQTDSGTFTLRYSFFACNGKTAVFSVLTLPAEKSFLKAANYMASTFKCS